MYDVHIEVSGGWAGGPSMVYPSIRRSVIIIIHFDRIKHSGDDGGYFTRLTACVFFACTPSWNGGMLLLIMIMIRIIVYCSAALSLD